jgi:putative sigma-54 modulation protein
MNIELDGRHFELTDALKSHVEKKLSSLEKYYDGIDRVHAILEVTGGINHVHVQLRGDRLKLDARSKSHDMYAAFDESAYNLERQLRKFKDRIHGHPHRRNGAGSLAAERTSGTYYVPAEVSELDRALLVRNDVTLARMTTNEAMTELEVDNSDHLVFYNTETESISAAYRTSTGASQVVELTEAAAART